MCYNERNEAQGPPEVESSTILDLIGSDKFMSYLQGLCHSFEGGALPPSLLFQIYLMPLNCMGQWQLSILKMVKMVNFCHAYFTTTF